ncbi:tetraacyldisaccharide 4'-kinase [Flavobacteriaceae bacterium MHTCC 0001]
MIEYLIRLLKNNHEIATLSRGYKRETVGFQIVNTNCNAKDVGDEPFQFYQKFGNQIQVAVDSNRVNGISQLMKQVQPANVILLDDAFQHRKVNAGLNILLTTYNNPFFKDIVLPTGDLREPRKGYTRADVIIVTKCPKTITTLEKEQFIKHINPRPKQHVFFSSISYAQQVLSANDKMDLKHFNDFTLVTGIANATPLVEFLKSKNLRFKHLNFKDHHEFSASDISNLKSQRTILTTEKDFMRLSPHKSLEKQLYYLPIEVTVDKNEIFDNLVKDFIDTF